MVNPLFSWTLLSLKIPRTSGDVLCDYQNEKFNSFLIQTDNIRQACFLARYWLHPTFPCIERFKGSKELKTNISFTDDLRTKRSIFLTSTSTQKEIFPVLAFQPIARLNALNLALCWRIELLSCSTFLCAINVTSLLR